MLLQFLQPIFLLSFLFLCFPGRDTQDTYFNDEGMYTAFLSAVLLPSVRLLLDFIVPLLRSSATCIFSLVLVLLGYFWLTAIPSKAHRFVRKHGRWRHSKFFPAVYLLYSSVAILNPGLGQALTYSTNRIRTITRTGGFWPSNSEPPDPGSVTQQVFQWAVNPDTPSDSFFHDDIFDFLPFEEEDPTEFIKPSCLHLSGYAKEWSKEHSHLDPFADIGLDDDDSETASLTSASSSQGESWSDSSSLTGSWEEGELDPLSFSSQGFYVPDDLADVYSYLSADSSFGDVLITPKYYANFAISDMPDLQLLLRTAKASAYRAEPGGPAPRIFPVLIDTGCSVATSGFVEDFGGVFVPGEFGQIKTANGLATIQGFGMVKWRTLTENGKEVTITVPAYYAPDIPLRLFSPQDYARYHKIGADSPDPNRYTMLGSASWFAFECQDSKPSNPDVVVSNLDAESKLFFFYSETPAASLPVSSAQPVSDSPSRCSCNNVSVHHPKNANLTASQKQLLLDHYRLGHLRMSLIQTLYTCGPPNTPPTPRFIPEESACDPCLLSRERGQSTCTIPLCATCQCAKARRRKTGSKRSKPNPDAPTLRTDDLKPGDCLSVDQYESNVRGRLPHTRGRERSTSRYRGGTLFFDHASSKVFVRHQVALDGYETVEAKRSVERDALHDGVIIKKYQADNGIFDSKAFEEALLNEDDADQLLKLSGVGAHHQNGVAERAIGTVSNMARALLLHVRMHWPDEFDAGLWPFALDYACWIYNHVPIADRGKMCPEELFSGAKSDCKVLRRLRVFGCPAYVLDPKMQNGEKVPKWSPRARCGMFLGFSQDHSTTVGLILNLRTGHISPQFHVVYDELFETVGSELEFDAEEKWLDLWENAREFYLEGWDEELDGPLPSIDPDFTDPEDEDEQLIPTVELHPPPNAEPPGWFDVEVNAPNPGNNPPRTSGDNDDSSSSSDESIEVLPPPTPDHPSILRNPLTPDTEASGNNSDGDPSPRHQSTERPHTRVQIQLPELDQGDDSNDDINVPLSPRHTRSGKRYGNSAIRFKRVSSRLYSHVRTIRNAKNLIYATLNWEQVTSNSLYQSFDHLFNLHVNAKTKELLDPDGIHPFALSSKMESEDYPSFKDILRMAPEERSKWFDSMDEEIRALFESGACELASKDEILRMKKEIVKSTWAFRKKRKPSGEVSRFKSRLCVRGDLQRDKDKYGPNETFAPVVDWMTVRLLFTLGIVENWQTASIDFKNAFTQAHLPEPIYLELPPGLKEANPDLKDKVIKVNTSLYGDRRAACLWYNKIADTLVNKLKFKSSELDTCLFIRKDCIIVLYVDDAILMAKDEETLQKVLKELDDEHYSFNRDGDFKSYLGIQISNLPDGSIKLSQPHLCRSLLDAVGMSDCVRAQKLRSRT